MLQVLQDKERILTQLGWGVSKGFLEKVVIKQSLKGYMKVNLWMGERDSMKVFRHRAENEPSESLRLEMKNRKAERQKLLL